MPSRLSLSPRANTALILALLALFVAVGYQHFAEDTGDDLAASYLGCRLLASGDGAHLYAHDPRDFAAVGDDDEWQAAADNGHFDSWLHPYVQTPLWAWSLQPLCTRLPFAAFDRLFDALTLASFAALIWISARTWAPRLWHPIPIALTLVALWFSTPFQYAMTLMQTHILFVLLTVAAVILAARRPVAAGSLLALAAAVKLTPAIFLVYWLLTRRYRAAATFLVVSAILLTTTRLNAGPVLFTQYLATLHRVSATLLVSENNQSLAAAWMGPHYPATEVFHLRILPLPQVLKLTSTALILLSAVAAGLLDRPRQTSRSTANPTAPSNPRQPRAAEAPPLGAPLLLVAATVFTPIAWTHYFIVLLPTLMVLADLALSRRSLPIALSIAATLALNLPPLASDVINITVGPHAILRSQFFAGILCLVTLTAAALTRRYDAIRPAVTVQASATRRTPPSLHRAKNS